MWLSADQLYGLAKNIIISHVYSNTDDNPLGVTFQTACQTERKGASVR